MIRCLQREPCYAWHDDASMVTTPSGHDAATSATGAPIAYHRPFLQLLTCLSHLNPLRRAVDARHLGIGTTPPRS